MKNDPNKKQNVSFLLVKIMSISEISEMVIILARIIAT